MFEFWTIKLSKEGYGSIEDVRNLNIKTFFNLIHYERYLNEYNQAFRTLNKKG